MSSGSIATEPMAVARQASLALHRLSLGGRTFQRQPSTQSQRGREGQPQKQKTDQRKPERNRRRREKERETQVQRGGSKFDVDYDMTGNLLRLTRT